MKFATIALLGILLLGAYAPLNAQPAGTSQVVMAYMNEELPPTATLPGFDGLCLIYYTLVGDLDLNSLFAGSIMGGLFGSPVVNRAHAYFIWASDYSAQSLGQNEAFTSFLITQGTATIYYSSTPEQRRFDLPTDRSSWGNRWPRLSGKQGCSKAWMAEPRALSPIRRYWCRASPSN